MINMDFSKAIAIDSDQLEWSPSPKAGVWRKRFARQEAEHGHATSVVWFEAGSEFNKHPHPKGEEIFVLEGVFSDHTGDYPAGSYLRNPEGFSHAPYSTNGCKLFVKLCQFQDGDQQHVLKPNLLELADGRHQLHQFNGEHTSLMKLKAGERCTIEQDDGFELFVLSGELELLDDDTTNLQAFSWYRAPFAPQALAATADAVVLVKQGHLAS